MIVSFDVPEISLDQGSFQNFWLNTMFVSHVSEVYQVNSLSIIFMRLVEAAGTEYVMGRQNLLSFWSTHSGVALGAMYRSVSHFESCLTNMHRAKNAFARLKNHRENGDLGTLLKNPPAYFVKNHFACRLAAIRNEVHHTEESLTHPKREFPRGSALMLRADGPETPHETELGQTNKVIDRLTIGRVELTFKEIAAALTEMGEFASKISGYVARPNPRPSQAQQ